MNLKRLPRKVGWLLLEKPKLEKAYKELKDREDLGTPGSGNCLGCVLEKTLRFTFQVLGRNTVAVFGGGCVAIGFAGYDRSPGMKITTVLPLLTHTASLSTGIKRHFQRTGQDVNVVAFCGDGSTADLSLASVSAAAERGENIIYICYDNQGTQNTGAQATTTTTYGLATPTAPAGARYHGKASFGKDMALLMALHPGVSYAATGSMAYPYDYKAKLEKALEVKDGMVYIHVFSPCVSGWDTATDNTLTISRMAVETNLFPLWEAEHGKFRLTKSLTFHKPVREYLKLIGGFSHLSGRQIDELQREVDKRMGHLKALAAS
ncbi:MAG: thiamine pyrophosphate-dependent enzyme [Chloroflexota bacterium]